MKRQSDRSDDDSDTDVNDENKFNFCYVCFDKSSTTRQYVTNMAAMLKQYTNCQRSKVWHISFE